MKDALQRLVWLLLDVPVVAERLYLYVFIVPHYYEMNVADGFSCSFAGSKIGGKRSYLEQ